MLLILLIAWWKSMPFKDKRKFLTVALLILVWRIQEMFQLIFIHSSLIMAKDDMNYCRGLINIRQHYFCKIYGFKNRLYCYQLFCKRSVFSSYFDENWIVDWLNVINSKYPSIKKKTGDNEYCIKESTV